MKWWWWGGRWNKTAQASVEPCFQQSLGSSGLGAALGSKKGTLLPPDPKDRSSLLSGRELWKEV